jgi:hypothetical protein
MEPYAGLRVWADHQSKNLPILRKLTSKTLHYTSALSMISREDRAVVFVEPRKHTSSEYVLRNMRHFLPTWKIIVVHGKDNEAFMKDICEDICGDIEFLNCKVADLPNPSYNTLFTSPGFWSMLPKYVLIAQTDTLLMKPAETMLEGFIAKDYAFVGAPWNYSCQRCKKPLSESCGHMIDQVAVWSMAPHMVGNGGLSFRNARKMEEICSVSSLQPFPCGTVARVWMPKPLNRTAILGTTNEDVFYCKVLTDQGHAMPTRIEALEFAVEQVAPLAWSGGPPALGAHKPWAYLPLPLVESMLDLVKY